MGFSFFKGFKIGPVRINLSKSGVGASVGAPGLRVGQSAKGQSYVAAGKGPVRFRETLATPARRAPPTNPSPQRIAPPPTTPRVAAAPTTKPVEAIAAPEEILIDGDGEFWVDIDGEEFHQTKIATVAQALTSMGATEPVVPYSAVAFHVCDVDYALSIKILDEEVGTLSDMDRFGVLTMTLTLKGASGIGAALICEEEGRLGIKLSIARHLVNPEHPDYAAEKKLSLDELLGRAE